MRARKPGVALAVAAAVAMACGEGHVLINVDLYSFLQTSAKDTIHYGIPSLPVPVDTSFNNPPLAVSLLPGVGTSLVNSVAIQGAGALVNQSDTASLSFRIYVASDSNGVLAEYADSTKALIKVSGNVAGNDSVTVPFQITVPVGQDTLFIQNKVFVGIQARVVVPKNQALLGRVRLTALNLIIDVQPKIF